MMTPRPKETLSNFRIGVQRLGSGWAAILFVDVTVKGRGTYTDVQQTGIGRYRTEHEAVTEAKLWSETDDIPLMPGVS